MHSAKKPGRFGVSEARVINGLPPLITSSWGDSWVPIHYEKKIKSFFSFLLFVKDRTIPNVLFASGKLKFAIDSVLLSA